jgi:hypothetical protein
VERAIQLLAGNGVPAVPTDGRKVLIGAAAAAQEAELQSFPHQYRFFAVPSLRATRLLLPVESPAVCLPLYAPCRLRAQVLKTLLAAAIKGGWKGRNGDRVVIASKEALPLQELVTNVTGEHRPAFALLLGTPDRYQKLTVLVMGGQGQTIGYVKLPLTDDSVPRIRHEAAVLRHLNSMPELQSRVPELLYAGSWAGVELLFFSAGPSEKGPLQLGPVHDEFLTALNRTSTRRRPGWELVEELATEWRQTNDMEAELKSSGEAALACAAGLLQADSVECGIIHGDFAPWNTRLRYGQLYVFDWESTAWDSPLCWDRFHFHIQVSSLLDRKLRLVLADAPERACFLLYLLKSLRQCLQAGHRDHVSVEFRRRLLRDQLIELGGRQSRLPTAAQIAYNR